MSAQLVMGFFSPWIVYAAVMLLHVGLPAVRLKGYARDEATGKLLEYKLNGHLVLPGSMLLWLVLGYVQLVPWTWLREARWASLAGAAALGLLFTALIVLPQKPAGKSILADLWLGRLKNPQRKKGSLLVDAKIWLYMAGAVMLQLNVLSLLAYHWESVEPFNPGLLMGAAMLTFFVWDFLSFERAHLYTRGFAAECVGFKLGFGCLAVFPFFYPIALWATAHLPGPGHPQWVNPIFILIFVTGWALSRGASLQKYYFKVSPTKKFFGIRPLAISDGKHALLASGFWGKSRHLNYFGEILMACAVALAPGHPGVLWVWLYPLFCAAHLLARQADDDKRCRAKYGELWDRYAKQARYRIIPHVY